MFPDLPRDEERFCHIESKWATLCAAECAYNQEMVSPLPTKGARSGCCAQGMGERIVYICFPHGEQRVQEEGTFPTLATCY